MNAILCALLVVSGETSSDPGSADPRPNIVIVMADDMGWSDLGCYGGEISTPSIDALAAGGLRFTQFYNAARCCPTRASLLTGLWPHQAGIGHMTSEDTRQTSDKGWPAYKGRLHSHTPTFAEVLAPAGYRSWMAGKWHVGTFEEMWPRARGFERFFGLARGASNFWRPGPEKLLMNESRPIEPPEDFYATDDFTDAAIRFVRDAEADDEEPFLLYLAYTAPHWPLHAPADITAKYRGRYREGWNVLRRRRFARQKELGLIPDPWILSPADAPLWTTIAEEHPDHLEPLDHRMSLYAAQVERLDWNVGRLVAALEETGELDDTLILFLIDNGGCAEGGNLGFGKVELLGTKEGYLLSYGRGWANASNTPFRRFKHDTHEGGISSPLVVHWPAGIEAEHHGALRHQPCHLVDLMATCIDLSGAGFPARFGGAPAPVGVSLLPAIRGEPLPERLLYWEHEGHRAVRRGDWKLVARHKGDWELYDMAADRTETRNLSAEHAGVRDELVGAYEVWAEEVGVRPWPVSVREGYTPPVREYPRTWDQFEEDG